MTTPSPGLTEVSCCASLENCQSLSDKEHTVFFDGTIFSAQPVQGSQEVLCPFCYFTPSNKHIPLNDYYEIKARVVINTGL